MKGYFKFDRLYGDPEWCLLQHLGVDEPSSAICGLKVKQVKWGSSIKLTVFVDRDHPALWFHDKQWLVNQIRNETLRTALHVLRPVDVSEDLDDGTMDKLLDRDIKVHLVKRS
ncbi:MAG: hypothetical protein OEQ39_25825 [Gammaproteobacteria bacterium]|nr:hypothetical protein [Gammaproteobacteria bacterium]